MRIIRIIAGRVFAIWALIIFVVTMLPAFLLIYAIKIFDEPKRTEALRSISNVWMRLFFFLTGCSLYRKGKNHFAPGVNYIVICNHNSMMDITITTPFIPGPANKTIAKIEMARIPMFGVIYQRGAVLVDRKDSNSRKDSMSKMKKVLEMGLQMCIYPEGTRNKTAQPLKEFHDGAFKLAMDTGRQIIPAILFNTKKVLDQERGFYFYPSRMEMHFLEPFSVNSSDDITDVKERTFRMMTEYYVANSDR